MAANIAAQTKRAQFFNLADEILQKDHLPLPPYLEKDVVLTVLISTKAGARKLSSSDFFYCR